MKHFVVVDMQNDFCTGALANKDAVAIIPRIKAELQAAKADEANIIFTRDTHAENYMETGEGKHLPVKHCVKDTEGWQVVPELMEETDENTLFIDKTHFGFDNWAEYVKEGDEVVICGTCTDICVVSNALALKAIEGVEVTVIADCCAGLTKESHEAALKVMECCQCNIR
jgi:nicotinamidase-related amidase